MVPVICILVGNDTNQKTESEDILQSSISLHEIIIQCETSFIKLKHDSCFIVKNYTRSDYTEQRKRNYNSYFETE
jgi:hypothetical protein